MAVMRQNFPFLAGMESFNMAGEPIFSDDDHRVTFPVRGIGKESGARDLGEMGQSIGKSGTVTRHPLKNLFFRTRVVSFSLSGVTQYLL